MLLNPVALQSLVAQLEAFPAVAEKARIDYAYRPAEEVSGGIRLGDDCAAIPDPVGGGHLLFAAEGMLPSFVEDDPWFAGYSAVMVNLSDVAAMGGRPVAITDIIWSSDDGVQEQIWEGMKAASVAYGVPIVGGHTTPIPQGFSSALGAAVLGRAGEKLITSFDAKPGDRLMLLIDMKGEYRKGKPFWNASTSTKPERLQTELSLLAKVADQGWSCAGKDISNGGMVGTLAMLTNTSKVAVELDLDEVPIPEDTSWGKWLTSFPSYGYFLAVESADVSDVKKLFSDTGITAVECGVFEEGSGVSLHTGGFSSKMNFSPEALVPA